MPTSALSFHCMICFEEFHHAERYPVVLPCGHTYVCHVCADRLDKCMECRTPLTWAVPKPSAPPAGNLSPTLGWSSRSSVGRNTSTAAGRVRRNAPVAMMEKKRLPLPKNVVLLSLMEATELASEMARSHSKIDSLLDTGVEEDEDDQEVDEDKKIKLSTSWTIGECGTYIVAAKDGLRILPSRPTKSSGVDTDRENKDTPSEDDVNALVRFFHLDQKVEASGSGEVSLMKSSSEEFEPIDRILQYGDRVQIVSLDDGWAKLARGYGFVRVNAGELVKGEVVR
jgi:Zinc finger, C3HC4 type (RING finger)